MIRRPSPIQFLLARSVRLAFCGAVLIAAAVHTTGNAYAEGAFSVSSATFPDGGHVATAQVFDQSGCNGGNRSPQLTWRDAPKGTRSFAITMFDPDAPGRGWWHWAVADIPARVTTLTENASASGTLAKLGAGEARGYRSAQRLQHRRLRRPLPAAWQAASIRDHGLCAWQRQSGWTRSGPARFDVRSRNRRRRTRQRATHRHLRPLNAVA
jgi:phosphatidylethanolamine-binding protein (PEBP) family uncharacterized protein